MSALHPPPLHCLQASTFNSLIHSFFFPHRPWVKESGSSAMLHSFILAMDPGPVHLIELAQFCHCWKAKPASSFIIKTAFLIQTEKVSLKFWTRKLFSSCTSCEVLTCQNIAFWHPFSLWKSNITSVMTENDSVMLNHPTNSPWEGENRPTAVQMAFRQNPGEKKCYHSHCTELISYSVQSHGLHIDLGWGKCWCLTHQPPGVHAACSAVSVDAEYTIREKLVKSFP